jgi:hypothetical protein
MARHVLTGYLIAVALLFGVRAATTLAGGADWALPGAGWRSVWQLAVLAVAIIGLAVPRLARWAVGLIGATYLLATVSELVDPLVLVGAIPVDMRDRLVHPLVGVLAVVALVVSSRLARRSAAPRPGGSAPAAP